MPYGHKEAAQAFIDALTTGDHAKGAAADKYLAPDVVWSGAARTPYEGHDKVLEHISGVWPNTPVYAMGDWSNIAEEGGKVVVKAPTRPVGAGPHQVNLTFSFNGEGQIQNVEQQNIAGQGGLVEGQTIPDFIKKRIDGALANNTPMSVGYVNEDGQPVITMRGSVQVFSDDGQLCVWVRNMNGGMGKSVQENPRMAFLYRDNFDRTTLTMTGVAHFDPDPAVREKVYALIPEVERNHEAWETGGALIVDLLRLDGGTPDGRARLAWSR